MQSLKRVKYLTFVCMNKKLTQVFLYLRGLIWQLGRNGNPQEAEEDFLKALYFAQQIGGEDEALALCREHHIPPQHLPQIIGRLCLSGDVLTSPMQLTKQGRSRALRLIRRHRIYEKYLSEHSGYDAREWHKRAHKMEHQLSAEEERRMATLLRNPLYDPHGDPIPTDLLRLPTEEEFTEQPQAGMWLYISHIEDDDLESFSHLEANGLSQGGCFYVEQTGADGSIDICYEGEHYHLSPREWRSMSLKRVDASERERDATATSRRLNRLQEGEQARIVALSPSCRGAVRRRLMDLGFVKGSLISIDMNSPLGNPTAYVVRGTAIALRHDQARYILVSQPSCL